MNKQSQPIIDLHDLKKLLQVCLANWYIIVGFLLAFTIAGYWYVFAKENYPCARVVLSTKFNSFAKKESSQDKEVEIDAYKLIENTIDRTQMDVSYYKLPNGTASTHDLLEEYRVAVDSIPFKTHLSITHKQLYDKNIRLKIIDDSRFEISYPWQATQITKQGYFDSVLNTPHLQLQATHYAYNKLLSPITPLYVLQIHNKEDVITAIQNRLDIKTQKETAQLLLEYSDWLPSNALSFLESFSQTYTQECLKQQQENNDKLLAGMDALLKKTEAALRDIQQDIWNNKTTTITNNKEEQAFFPLADVMVEKKE
jgi:hypothetical protein